MKRENILAFVAAFFTLQGLVFAADIDSTVKKEVNVPELNATYSMESQTANKFLGLGLVSKYELTTNGKLCAIMDLDFMYGIFGTKIVSDVNFLAGLRSYMHHGQFGIYYEIETGLGVVDNHDGTQGYLGNYSRVKIGFRYSPVALEFSLGTSVSKDFEISPISGLGLAVSF